MTRFLFFCKSLGLWRKPTADRWTQSAACKQNGSHSLHFWLEDFFLALSGAEGAAITSVEWGGWCRWIPVAHKELHVTCNRGGLVHHNLSALVKVAFSSSSSNLLVPLNCSHYAPQHQSSVGAWLLHKLILMTVCVTRLSGSIWGGSKTGQPVYTKYKPHLSVFSSQAAPMTAYFDFLPRRNDGSCRQRTVSAHTLPPLLAWLLSLCFNEPVTCDAMWWRAQIWCPKLSRVRLHIITLQRLLWLAAPIRRENGLRTGRDSR